MKKKVSVKLPDGSICVGVYDVNSETIKTIDGTFKVKEVIILKTF
jgi:hypothetical protein